MTTLSSRICSVIFTIICSFVNCVNCFSVRFHHIYSLSIFQNHVMILARRTNQGLFTVERINIFFQLGYKKTRNYKVGMNVNTERQRKNTINFKVLDDETTSPRMNEWWVLGIDVLSSGGEGIKTLEHKHEWMNARTHKYAQTHALTHKHKHRQTCMHASIHPTIHVCMHAPTHPAPPHTYTYIHTFVRTYIRACLPTYVRTYILRERTECA